jgi:hypothetical protein
LPSVYPYTTATDFYANNDISVKSGALYASPWLGSTNYAVGALVRAPNGHVYVCITPGTSGASQPTWPTNGGTVTDSGVVWQDRPVVLPNTLGDLTRRECRFAHLCSATDTYPFDVRRWTWQYVVPPNWNVYVNCPQWTASTYYQIGNVVHPTPKNGYYYVCSKVGISNTTAPAWPTSGTFVDNTVIWQTLPQIYFDITALPTLRECSSANWIAGIGGIVPTPMLPTPPIPSLTNDLMFGALSRINASVADRPVDFWGNDRMKRLSDSVMTAPLNLNIPDGPRIADDVILTNVIGFDVKAWDPNVMRYVDLDYKKLGYDTYSTTCESPNASNGFDDDGNGIVDDDAENLTPPPYPIPLRGIQVKIRIFEPDSRQIREVTVVQDFLPQ